MIAEDESENLYTNLGRQLTKERRLVLEVLWVRNVDGGRGVKG